MSRQSKEHTAQSKYLKTKTQDKNSFNCFMIESNEYKCFEMNFFSGNALDFLKLFLPSSMPMAFVVSQWLGRRRIKRKTNCLLFYDIIQSLK